ncbi:hypothetical protein M0R04_12460 [Candidatus Dojkabacteria bacterium]|jgi:hypothetical protein|nr:hypothetical protein [Candidatus Dojkabacteria bacterium]
MNNTKHIINCNRVFKNYDLTCPRCLELSKGATARDGWQKAYFANKKLNTKENFAYCGHNNLNAGGYCNTCGNGRDFS